MNDPGVFEANLMGSNESPAVQTAAGGNIVATLDGNVLRITGSFSGLESPYVASNIHRGKVDENGPAVFALSPVLSADQSGGMFYEALALTGVQIAELATGGYYVNVQTAERAGGEIRGQLHTLATRTFSAGLFGSGVNSPFGRALGILSGGELRITGFIANLNAVFAVAGLYPANDEQAGPLVTLNGSIDSSRLGVTFLAHHNIISLTDAMVEQLVSGRISLRVYETGSPSSVASGQLQATLPGLGVFEARLSGMNVGETVNTPAVGRVVAILGTPSFGMAHLQVIGSFSYLNDETAQAAIYAGRTGEAGPLVVALDEVARPWPDPQNERILRRLDYLLTPDAVQDLFNGSFYVSVRSTAYPGGEIRGQLTPMHTQWSRASLTGSAEIPPVDTPASGFVTLLMQGSETRMTGSFQGLTGDFTTAQLHIGGREENSMPFWTVSPLVSEDGREGVILRDQNTIVLNDAQVDAARVGRLYVNVSSTAYVGGEIRGHFQPPGSVDVEAPAELPKGLKLAGNFPNPFNPSTQIVFDLPVRAEVQVEVFDLLGRRVQFVEPQLLEAGPGRTVFIDAASLTSGMYVYAVTMRSAGGIETASGKMLLLK